jgi:hypothetical protein
MRAIKVLLSALCAAVLVWGAPASTATAMESWCEDDPPVVIITPGGSMVIVYVTSGAIGLEHLVALQLATIRHTVTPANGGLATHVDMTVEVPNDLFASGFPTRTTVSSGPFKLGTIHGTAMGRSGEPMHVAFQLPVP